MYVYIFFLASDDACRFLDQMGYEFVPGTIGNERIAALSIVSQGLAQTLFSEMKSRNLASRWFIELR